MVAARKLSTVDADLLMKARYIPPNTAMHAGRLERWLGAEKLDYISRAHRNWYGPPIKLIDVPGNVWVTGGGDFIGTFEKGFFASALDAIEDFGNRLWRESGRIKHAQFAAGFPSFDDALSRSSGGFRQMLGGGPIMKSGSPGVTGRSNSLWRLGPQPAAGAAPGAAPGGRIPTSATQGALFWTNPAAGTMRLTGADMACSVAGNALILYDRIFDVAKTMNSTATEAVTGVPTRFQSTVSTSEDYIGGNFLFMEVGATSLPATAHNWTVCTYLDQANAASTLPSQAGVSGAVLDTIDLPVNQYFAPLEAGDHGIKALTQMQCSALVASGSVNFVLGHHIGVLCFPAISGMFPHDWFTNRDLGPYIPNNACLAFLEPNKPSATSTTYNGVIYGVSTAS